jgi:hypothetical protein
LAGPELLVERAVVAMQRDDAGGSRPATLHCVHESIVPANLFIDPSLPGWTIGPAVPMRCPDVDWRLRTGGRGAGASAAPKSEHHAFAGRG